jgi:hypothetical protein
MDGLDSEAETYERQSRLKASNLNYTKTSTVLGL